MAQSILKVVAGEDLRGQRANSILIEIRDVYLALKTDKNEFYKWLTMNMPAYRNYSERNN